MMPTSLRFLALTLLLCSADCFLIQPRYGTPPGVRLDAGPILTVCRTYALDTSHAREFTLPTKPPSSHRYAISTVGVGVRRWDYTDRCSQAILVGEGCWCRGHGASLAERRMRSIAAAAARVAATTKKSLRTSWERRPSGGITRKTRWARFRHGPGSLDEAGRLWAWVPLITHERCRRNRVECVCAKCLKENAQLSYQRHPPTLFLLSISRAARGLGLSCTGGRKKLRHVADPRAALSRAGHGAPVHSELEHVPDL